MFNFTKQDYGMIYQLQLRDVIEKLVTRCPRSVLVYNELTRSRENDVNYRRSFNADNYFLSFARAWCQHFKKSLYYRDREKQREKGEGYCKMRYTRVEAKILGEGERGRGNKKAKQTSSPGRRAS